MPGSAAIHGKAQSQADRSRTAKPWTEGHDNAQPAEAGWQGKDRGFGSGQQERVRPNTVHAVFAALSAATNIRLAHARSRVPTKPRNGRARRIQAISTQPVERTVSPLQRPITHVNVDDLETGMGSCESLTLAFRDQALRWLAPGQELQPGVRSRLEALISVHAAMSS